MKDINYNKVKSYIEKSEFHHALDILFQELIEDPNNYNVNSLIGFCYRAICDFEQALRYYIIATKLNPNDYSSFLGIGIVYQLEEKYDESIIALKTAIRIDPKKFEAINSLGFTYKKMGEIDKALIEYNRALEVLNNSFFNYLLCNDQDSLGNSTDGKIFNVNPEFFNKMEKLYKSNISYASIMSNIGGCYLEIGEFQKAKECFLTAIEYTPNGSFFEPPYNGLKYLESINIR